MFITLTRSRPVPRLPFGLWLRRWRTRRHLADLPPERLDDLALDPAAARAEARRPFWR